MHDDASRKNKAQRAFDLLMLRLGETQEECACSWPDDIQTPDTFTKEALSMLETSDARDAACMLHQQRKHVYDMLHRLYREEVEYAARDRAAKTLMRLARVIVIVFCVVCVACVVCAVWCMVIGADSWVSVALFGIATGITLVMLFIVAHTLNVLNRSQETSLNSLGKDCRGR